MVIVMDSFHDKTTSFYNTSAPDDTDPTGDHLLILSDYERREYFDEIPEIRLKKSRVKSVIQYLRKIIES